MIPKNRVVSSSASAPISCVSSTVDNYDPFVDGSGVALYKMEGNANDESGNYNGTAANVTYGAGQFGQAGVLNGTSSSISLNSKLIPATSSFSTSLWLNSQIASGDRGVIFCQRAQTDYAALYTMLDKRPASIGLKVFIGTGNNYSEIDLGDKANDVWHNVVVTYDSVSREFKAYHNGTIGGINSGVISNISQASNTVLGKYGDLNQIFFKGSIDQFRIYNRALSAAEVTTIYDAELAQHTI